MQRFTRLFTELDQTNRTNEKVAALESYFREAAPADAAWALYFLSGRRLPRTVTSTAFAEWAAAEAGLPAWLVDECYDTVGDLAETIALLLPKNVSTVPPPLHEIVEQRVFAMRDGTDATKRSILVKTWRELDSTQRFVWNKILTGGFRVGVAQTLVVRALANVAGIAQSVMAHRLTGNWEPTPADFQRIVAAEDGAMEPAKPYPFFLASPLEGHPPALGDIGEWMLEWKWDGIRAQLIRRREQTLIWSRGDELVTAAFPEIAEAAAALPDGTVLDGEILAWKTDAPLPFSRLQRRLGRKTVSAKTRKDFPVVFLAYDLLESEGQDLRERSLEERRRLLEEILARIQMSDIGAKNTALIGENLELFPTETPGSANPLRLSESLHPSSWEALAELQRGSRERGVEGIMLKRRSSPYSVGRPRGDWWKWKIDPLTIDAVMISAQSGHGRRANLYTDYTFGVWHEGALVPIAKAYSGLDDAEIREVDRFVRANTTGKFGPIRTVTPELVFELAFEAVQESTRHKTGLAVRFPRINRWRRDKKPAEADTLDNLRAFIR